MKITCILETPIYREDWENEPHKKEDPGENMPGTPLKWDQALPIALPWISVALWRALKLSPFETVYRRPFQVSVLKAPPLDLEQESNTKTYVQHLG